jgi:cytochrome c5
MSPRSHRHWAIALASLALGACNPAPTAPVVDLASARPADPAMAALYERACKNCHAVPGTGAPVVSDKAAWAARESGGIERLVGNVRAGMGTMPPMGWCPECSDEDLRRLIGFLQTGDQK